MLCFARVEEVSGRPCRAEGRRDVVSDLPSLPHTRGDEATATLMHVLQDQADSCFVVIVLRDGTQRFDLSAEDLRDGILLRHVARAKLFLFHKDRSFPRERSCPLRLSDNGYSYRSVLDRCDFLYEEAILQCFINECCTAVLLSGGSFLRRKSWRQSWKAFLRVRVKVVDEWLISFVYVRGP